MRQAPSALRYAASMMPVLAIATGVAQAQAPAPEAAPVQPVPAQGSSPPTAMSAQTVLLRQANYWLSQSQPERAQQALERLLLLDPKNPDGLALLGQIQAERGDRPGAQATLAKLRAERPEDPRVAQLQQALRVGQIDSGALADARRLAQQGRNAEAVGRYQSIFHGAPPPASLAVEFYQTLAGTDGGWQQARDGLAQIIAATPQDTRAQLAFAELLTYHEDTRLDGVNRLARLAQNQNLKDAATKAWRQALQWLPIASDSIPAYEAYLAQHRDDAGVATLIQQAKAPVQTPADVASERRSAGFAALKANRLKDAEAAFQEVLAQNPQDSEALGGLGLVRLGQGNTTEARDLLSKAIAADPEHRARWASALAGASVSQDYAAARSLIDRGQLDAAERQIRAIIARGGDIAGAQAMLGDVQARRGDLTGAESSYRAALAHQPGNSVALLGLAKVLTSQGRSGEADALIDRLESSGNQRLVGQVRAETLRTQATKTPDPTEKLALLRAAVAAEPSNAWLRLDLARALAATGQNADARQVMADLTTGPHPSVDALRAGAIFATEDNRPDEAAKLITRLPAAARTPQMTALLGQAKLDSDIRAAIWQSAASPAATRERLLSLAAQPDPEGVRGVAIARAFLQMGDTADARAALATAQAATRNPTVQQRISYAGVMLSAGMTSEAQILIRSLDGAQGLTADQTVALKQLRAGAAIRASDRLNNEDRTADAYDQLAPALARDPNDPNLNMALARLYQTAQEPRKALAINQALLQRDPSNLDARRGAVDAAIQLQEWRTAEALSSEGLRLAPNDPRAWLISADLHRARGNNRRALEDLKTAQGLRAQQIGVDRPTPLPFRSSAGGPNLMVANMEAALPPVGENPFRRGSSAADTTTSMSPLLATAPAPDQMSADIAKDIAAVQEDLAPKVTFGPELRQRTGSSGLDRLTEFSGRMEATLSPWGVGKLRLSAIPTSLSAGQLAGDPDSQRQFGTGAFGGPAPGSQYASGVGLSAAYSLGWFSGDIGTTPIGFLEQNIVGGVELSPMLSDNVRLRLVGERRAVTDSLLSYAGTTDTRTGINWGGVTRTRGHAQLELSLGLGNFYVGGGYAVLDGTNVPSNQEYEFGAGGSYPIWRNGDEEVRLGLDLVYFAYNKNLRFFSLGQGGYFSPQSYFATLIPISYKRTSGDLTWSVGGAIGYQNYTEHASPVFPNNAGLQSALQAQIASAGSSTTAVAFYPSKAASGLVGNARASIDYRINSALRIGGQASYQHAGDWSEAQGTLFARYIFSD